MPGWRSRPARAAAWALAALALAGCPTREVEPRPFHLEARHADGGSLADGVTAFDVLPATGVAHVVDATTLVVAGTERGDVTLTFDRSAAPSLAFPAFLEGRTVLAEVFVDPGRTGPRGEPLPIPGYRLSTAGSFDFVIGEWTGETPVGGDPRVPPSFTLFSSDPDLPRLGILAEYADWEASECGLVYFLPLFALDGTATVSLDRGAVRRFDLAPRAEPLFLLHVLTYQRLDPCDGQSRSWTQIAAWREPAD